LNFGSQEATCAEINKNQSTANSQLLMQYWSGRDFLKDCQRLVYMRGLAPWVVTIIDPNNQDASGVIMTSGIVSLKVTTNIAIDCDFWSQGDGWLSKSPSATVRGRSFEDAKKNMATELQAQIERMLREHPKRSPRLAQTRPRISQGNRGRRRYVSRTCTHLKPQESVSRATVRLATSL